MSQLFCFIGNCVLWNKKCSARMRSSRKWNYHFVNRSRAEIALLRNLFIYRKSVLIFRGVLRCHLVNEIFYDLFFYINVKAQHTDKGKFLKKVLFFFICISNSDIISCLQFPVNTFFIFFSTLFNQISVVCQKKSASLRSGFIISLFSFCVKYYFTFFYIFFTPSPISL